MKEFKNATIIKDKTVYKHNGIISFWKFLFSIMIVIYHFNLSNKSETVILKYGYIGVEYFFLVSGYLMAKAAMKKKSEKSIGKETFAYILKKIKSFFPYMLVAFGIALSVRLFFRKSSINEIVNSIWNLFFLETSGIKTTLVLGQTWYISAMLISMLILYPLIRKYKDNFIYLIAPVITISIGGWLSYTYGTLNGWQHTGFAYKCLLRAFFELSLGTMLYEITNKIRTVKFTKLARILLTIIEICGFASIFFITNIEKASTKYELHMILILSISIVIAFSEKTILYNFANNKFSYYLERLSLPIYLNHNWIITVINKNFTDLNYFKKLGITIIVTIIFSIIIMYLIEWIKKNGDKSQKFIKKIFIADC